MTRKDWYMYLIKITLVTTLVALGRDFGFRGKGFRAFGFVGSSVWGPVWDGMVQGWAALRAHGTSAAFASSSSEGGRMKPKA